VSGTDALGWIASAVILVRLLPQPVRLVRTGVAAGVSPLAALNAVVTTVGWTVYGFAADLPIVWIVSVVALVPSMWTVALLVPRTTRRDVATASLWAATLVAAALVGVGAAAMSLGVLVSQGPQVVRAVRESDLSGVAPATWWLSLLDAATWGAYGVAVADGALMGYGVVLATASLVVLGRIAWTRGHGRTEAHPDALGHQPLAQGVPDVRSAMAHQGASVTGQ
jgi:uncharacterized protein with PQ loop repeat